MHAAEEEPSDPDPDHKTEEELASPVLGGIRHGACLVPSIEIGSPEVRLLACSHEIARCEGSRGLESVDVQNDQACEAVAAVKA